MSDVELIPESRDAVHAARDAAQALETAREVQLAETVEKTAQRTKDALLEGLREVFGGGDAASGDMKVLVHRIPILCTRIDAMDKNIEDMRDNIKWGVRVAIGAFITLGIGGIVSLIF